MKNVERIITELQKELDHTHRTICDINSHFRMIYRLKMSDYHQVRRLRKLKVKIMKDKAIYNSFDSSIKSSQKRQVFDIYDKYEDEIVAMYNLNAHTPEGHEAVITWYIKLLVSLIVHLKKIDT